MLTLRMERINPLTPRSDQHETYPYMYNILTLSSKQVMTENIHTYLVRLLS